MSAVLGSFMTRTITTVSLGNNLVFCVCYKDRLAKPQTSPVQHQMLRGIKRRFQSTLQGLQGLMTLIFLAAPRLHIMEVSAKESKQSTASEPPSPEDPTQKTSGLAHISAISRNGLILLLTHSST